MEFDNASDVLSQSVRALLDTLAAALKHERLKDSRFVLAGHTRGTGVAAQRMSAYGSGSERPLPGVPATAQQNRRVEVRAAP